MKIAILSIGIPGSGKSSVLKPLAEKYAFAYICPDDIREEINGDALNRTNNAFIWEEVRRRVTNALISHTGIVIDATFVDRRRIEFISFLKTQGIEIVYGIEFSIPLERAIERNAKRERNVKESAIESKYLSLQNCPPTLGDGFTALYQSDQLTALYENLQKICSSAA